MIKDSTIQRKIKRIDDALDRMEQGKYADLKLSKICDTIVWLYKFRHIDEAEMNRLTGRATDILKNSPLAVDYY